MIFFNLIIASLWSALPAENFITSPPRWQMCKNAACMCHIRGVISAEEESRKIAARNARFSSARGIKYISRQRNWPSPLCFSFILPPHQRDAPPAPPNVIFRVWHFSIHTQHELLFCFACAMACVALFPPATHFHATQPQRLIHACEKLIQPWCGTIETYMPADVIER